jgi:hypothetical protein
MQSLDYESFETRAQFFGRSLEEELVGCLDGQRGIEARERLRDLAQRRQVGIDDIILSVSLQTSLIDIVKHAKRVCFPSSITPPEKIFEVEECPVCTETNALCALECGHVICVMCHDELCRRKGGVCLCPICRNTSRQRWLVSELKYSA